MCVEFQSVRRTIFFWSGKSAYSEDPEDFGNKYTDNPIPTPFPFLSFFFPYTPPFLLLFWGGILSLE